MGEMSLREAREAFTLNFAKLILFAFSKEGRTVTVEETKRSPEDAMKNEKSGVGVANSAHINAHAGDLNLYIDGVWQKDSDAHKELGEYWKSLHPLNRWGGDFRRKDGNHYSMLYGGRM